MRISVAPAELEALARQYERDTRELAGIALDLRRRLSDDLLERVAAYGLTTRHLAYESQGAVDELIGRVAELERFTLDIERVWAEARGLAQDGRLAPGVSGSSSDLWWFKTAAAGGHGSESPAFAGIGETTAAVGIAGGASASRADAAIAAVIQVATAEVGTVESGGEDGHSGNITKYWAELHPAFQRQPWCAAFVSWVMLHGGCPLPAIDQWYGFAYVPHAYEYYRALGRVFSEPLPGDIVTLYDQGHTGIVTAGLDATGYFHTVEGNTSPGTSGSQSNGGGVYARVHRVDAVTAFCRPDYGGVHP